MWSSEPMELVCAVQNYHWGKKGKSSLVHKFAAANLGTTFDENKPFAEFWVGTHPSGPSYIRSTKTELSQHLILHPDELGVKVVSCFGSQLPFLFKILSVEEPLSIQAHPTKSHAEKLFREFPQIYRDGNHKPELAIALTKFEVLCSFRPLPEIKHFLKSIPEFKMVIDSKKIEKFCDSDENSGESSSFLKDCFQSLMLSDPDVVAAAIEKFIARCETFGPSEEKEYLVPLVKRIHSLFPKDVGVFCVFLLNYIVLSPGEALYLAPNEPHAYLHGDCLECMANSDNVVRAGLTPKFKDVQTLCEMLSYKNYHSSDVVFCPQKANEFCELYCPPIKDFAVAKITLPKGEKYNIKKMESASVLLVMQGTGKLNDKQLEFGKVFFVPSMSECSIQSDGLVLFQAYCNV